MSSISNNINDEVKKSEISEFNSQFESYADRKSGISLQDFATIYNLIDEWNKNNVSDAIELSIKTKNVKDTSITRMIAQLANQIKKDYTKDKIPVESILEIDNKENLETTYYFEFKSSGIKYNSNLDDPSSGRINKIEMTLQKRK